MDTRTKLLSVMLVAGLCIPAWAQDAGKARRAPTKQLIEQLGDAGYDNRQEAEKKLLELGKAAKKQLQDAASNHDDPEVRWRAQRILRKLDQGAKSESRPRGLRRRQPGDRRADPGDPESRRGSRRNSRQIEDIDRAFEDILRRLETELDIDITNVRKHIERARDQARELDREFGRAFDRDFARSFDSQRSSKNMKMSLTPDGVRVEVQELDKDGKSHKKVYEAKDMEAFKAKYPDVLKRHGIDGGIRILRSGDPFRSRMPDFFRDREGFNRRLRQQLRDVHKGFGFQIDRDGRIRMLPRRDLGRRGARVEVPEAPSAGDRLGVYVSDVPATVAEFLGLERGHGLKIDEVIDGSLAQKLGIRAGDIVLKVGKRKVHSVPDVAKGLREVKAGETISVQVNRRGRTMGLGIKKPAPKGDRKKDVDVEVDEVKPKKLKRRGKVR